MDEISLTEVSRRTGLSARTLRFWEAQGLVHARRTRAGQRVYDADALARLAQVAALKRGGFTLGRIAELLGAHAPDLAAVIAAQREALAAERRAIDAALAGLAAAAVKLSEGEPLGVGALCDLIAQGERIMAQQAWKPVIDRYYTPEQQAHWKERMSQLPENAIAQDYDAKWRDLGRRIEAALPLDPAGPEARAFLAEWNTLLAPFTAVADDAMRQGAVNLYEHIDEWKGMMEPPFSSRVYTFVKEATRAQRVGTGTPLE